MVASVIFNENNLVGEVKTDKTSGTVRFKNADDAVVDTSDPLVIPSSGQEYSYEKALRLRITGTAPDTEITDVEWYLDGTNSFGTGVLLWAVYPSAFTTPQVPVETNDPPLMPVGGTPVAATDAFAKTAASPQVLGAGPFSSINTDIGNYVYLVMEINSTATQGTLTGETMTFEYDEI